MSSCLDKGSSPKVVDTEDSIPSIPTVTTTTNDGELQPLSKNITKIIVSSSKVVNQIQPPLITVLNSSGPLTIVKTISATSTVTCAPQFTVVNSVPLNVAVVKAIATQNPETRTADLGVPTPENRGHNVFVKNTCPDITVPDMPQSHKLLTATNFPQSNVLASITPINKKANGQRNKLKILGNVVVPGPSQTANVLINKTNNPQHQQQRYLPKKVIGANGAPSSKYLKSNLIKQAQEKSPTRLVYPTHKSQLKTLPPMPASYMAKSQGIKTLAPQHKPAGVQTKGRTGLRTIPPQRPPKLPNKPNYIGKHAVQAQKMRGGHGKAKAMKMPMASPQSYNYHGAANLADKHAMTFNQALTAEILETLGNRSTSNATSNSYPSKHYEILPSRYESTYGYPEKRSIPIEQKQIEEKSDMGTLSLVCQAVLLDHNYNAQMPPDSPRTVPSAIVAPINGASPGSMYSPPIKRRTLSSSNNAITSASNNANTTLVPSISTVMRPLQDDDAASDVSDISDRKIDTECEDTDTAPEAEAVTSEQYGDTVTRCICGFEHDDGYMVECEHCQAWQHVQCVIRKQHIPETYLCELCDTSKPIDRNKARTLQQQWLRDRNLLTVKMRKEVKGKADLKALKPATISDTDSSDGEQMSHNNNVVSKNRTLSRRKGDPPLKLPPAPPQPTRQRRDSAKEGPKIRQKKRERKVVKRKTKALPNKSHSDDENQQDTWASRLPQLHQWIERYEDAVTNHYSPELRARISNIRSNGAHSDLSTPSFDASVQKCRVHTQPLTEIKSLVSTMTLEPGTSVVELRGKYMLSHQHRHSSAGLPTRQHSQRPGPFLFFYILQKDNTEVCVDTRTYGNSARFIRRSCKPNAELQHCIEKGVLHLYIVTIAGVGANCELTIKHESHDLAAIGTTQIACACGVPDECTVNQSTIKRNGESPPDVHRKRRGRRTGSAGLGEPAEVKLEVKVEKQEPLEDGTMLPTIVPKLETNVDGGQVGIEKAITVSEVGDEKVVKSEIKLEDSTIKLEDTTTIKEEDSKVGIQSEVKAEDLVLSPSITSRRSSQYKSDKEDEKLSKKLSREDRKMEAILRAIEQMEKSQQRKQEHQAKQAHRRESEPGPTTKEDDKAEPKMKRRRRKGRARTTSTNINAQSNQRNRLNSTESSYMTSGDETMLSPCDNLSNSRPSMMKELNQNDKAVGLLLALSNGGDNTKSRSPTREMDSNSNSAHSSPETQLSSACLLVQAAVEPLETGFKFPKTKKILMNEWLNKGPDAGQSAMSSSVSTPPHINSASSDYETSVMYSPTKNLVALAQAASLCDSGASVAPRGSAKKRWLRQAISEDHCDSPASRPESPPLSEMVAPPKKRRLPRESLSNEASPPTTPTNTAPVPTVTTPTFEDFPPANNKKSEDDRTNCQESSSSDVVFSGVVTDTGFSASPVTVVMDSPEPQRKPLRNEMTPLGCLMDPRLAREHNIFSTNSDHLVGTVEKTLSILGLQEGRPEAITPSKRKLSISEYRQRKKLNNNDKTEEPEPDPTSPEDNNSSESFKATRQRADSSDGSTSLSSTDDEEMSSLEIVAKPPAFNSEPTELELQREISNFRLKRAFGMPIDNEETKLVLDVEAILNTRLHSLNSPTFPITGSGEVTSDGSSPSPPRPPTPLYQPPPPPDVEEVQTEPALVIEESPLEQSDAVMEELTTVEEKVVEDEEKKAEEEVEVEEAVQEEETDESTNIFYTPDDLDPMETVQHEDREFVSYVPPFNNPVYPNISFETFPSTIDDDARYEGRNPSPPPHLDASSSFSDSPT